MNENLNLCEILKGHNGETFYNPYYGDVTLSYITENYVIFKGDSIDIELVVERNGRVSFTNRLNIFPSKNQRDWNKWIEEQKPKTPKTWSEIKVDKHSDVFAIELRPVHDGNYQNYHHEESIWSGSPIEKSALALLKIHQLIEVGYGGNVSKKEWLNDEWKYCIVHYSHDNSFNVERCYSNTHLIAFHTKEQAEEFLSYPENIQLLKDYFLIN